MPFLYFVYLVSLFFSFFFFFFFLVSLVSPCLFIVPSSYPVLSTSKERTTHAFIAFRTLRVPRRRDRAKKRLNSTQAASESAIIFTKRARERERESEAVQRLHLLFYFVKPIAQDPSMQFSFSPFSLISSSAPGVCENLSTVPSPLCPQISLLFRCRCMQSQVSEMH